MLIRRMTGVLYHNILHADDPPRRLALGAAIGAFVTFTPTLGFQMAIVVFLAWLLNANKVVGLPIVWVSNPVTFVPIFFPCYWLGAMLLGMDPWEANWRGISHSLANQESWWATVEHFWSFAWRVAGPLWLGSILVGLFWGAVTYPLTYMAVVRLRARRQARLATKRWFRRAAAPSAELLVMQERAAAGEPSPTPTAPAAPPSPRMTDSIITKRAS